MGQLLLEGLSDAAGFVGGALLAWWLRSLVRLDPLAPGYGARTLGAIALAGVGGGAGPQLARHWRKSRRKEQ